jgi:hypothetical protein
MDLYIKSLEDPNYDENQLQVDEDIALIISQIETLVFTQRGDVMGDPDFGLNLEDYVYSFRYNDTMLQGVVQSAISRNIPLAAKIPVHVTVEFASLTEKNVVFIDITIDYRFGITIAI